MRKIIVTEFLSLDGVMEAPEKWSFPYMNDEIMKFKSDELFASGALLLGRATYESSRATSSSRAARSSWGGPRTRPSLRLGPRERIRGASLIA